MPSAAESGRISSVNVTAVLLSTPFGTSDEASGLIKWHPLETELPAVASDGDGTALFFVHSHRHRLPYFEAHADVFRASSHHPFVSSAHVLLFCNNPRLSSSMLLTALSRYPMAGGRLLIHTAVNVGYRCGLLHSLTVSSGLWTRYAVLLVTHPDVYLFPRAISRVATVLRSQPKAAFIGSPGLVDLPLDPITTNCRATGSKSCRERVHGFLSDLFLVRPPLLIRNDGVSLFSNASARCQSSWRVEGTLLAPEAALWEGVAAAASKLRYGVLGGRRSGMRQHLLSADGILHTHNESTAKILLLQPSNEVLG